MSEARTGRSQYVVQPDDSLVDIASATYGDGGLWSVIADANGVAVTGNPDQPLPSSEAGKTYEIPGTTSTKQSATAFNPYAFTELLGEDRPFAIPSPPPPHHSDLEILALSALRMGV